MKISTLARTNIIIVLITLFCFSALFYVYYKSYNKKSMAYFEKTSSDNVSRLYRKLSAFFLQPITISRAMAKNFFLISYLESKESDDQLDCTYKITEYLRRYGRIYDFDGAFLISTKNKSLYTQDGLIEKVENENVHHAWFEKTIASEKDYDINIDIDKTISSNNEISLFVNYKIFNDDYKVIGITGICVHIESIINTFRDFEKESNSKAYLIKENGLIQVSSDSTGLSEVNFFEFSGNESVKNIVKECKENYKINKKTHYTKMNPETNEYIALLYIPEISSYLITEYYLGDYEYELRENLVKSLFIILFIMTLIIVFISYVVSNFEKKIKFLAGDRLKYFHDATRCMYFSIYEIDLTHDCFSSESKYQQFKLNKVSETNKLSYTESLKILTNCSIKEEYRENFLKKFLPSTIIENFKKGVDRSSYDCEVLLGKKYHWMNFNAHSFLLKGNNNIYMYLYVKNIDKERNKQEVKNTKDDLTGCLLRGETISSIKMLINENPENKFAFFIIDIDNFKSANDTFGHAFGDLCIKSFANTLKNNFRKDDIIGRIGGDEFVVFIPYPNITWLTGKAYSLVKALEIICEEGESKMFLSASIGIAICPDNGRNFEELYRKADEALYKSKQAGKNRFTFYN